MFVCGSACVVSKNGSLLLSVPLRGDGTPDELAIAVVFAITTAGRSTNP